MLISSKANNFIGKLHQEEEEVQQPSLACWSSGRLVDGWSLMLKIMITQLSPKLKLNLKLKLSLAIKIWIFDDIDQIWMETTFSWSLEIVTYHWGRWVFKEDVTKSKQTFRVLLYLIRRPSGQQFCSRVMPFLKPSLKCYWLRGGPNICEI